MAWTFKTKRGVSLHAERGWIHPIRWMRGLRTSYFFIGVIRCDDPYKTTPSQKENE